WSSLFLSPTHRSAGPNPWVGGVAPAWPTPTIELASTASTATPSPRRMVLIQPPEYVDPSRRARGAKFPPRRHAPSTWRRKSRQPQSSPAYCNHGSHRKSAHSSGSVIAPTAPWSGDVGSVALCRGSLSTLGWCRGGVTVDLVEEIRAAFDL